MPPFENDADTWTGLYGISVDEDDYGVEPHAVPLIGVQVQAQVCDFIAQVKLSQSYHNDSDHPIECIYHFPMDSAAAVCGFEAEYENGTKVKGVIKEKETAQKVYQEAKRAGKQANLLQSVRRDVFTLNVGNLPAGGYVKINVTYVTTLQARDSVAAFILPTYIAPRYTPVSDGVSSSLEALAPPTTNVKLFGLDIRINATCHSKIKAITCPTHAKDLCVSTTGKNGSIALSDIAMDRDVVILIEEAKCHEPRASIEVDKDGTMTGFVTFYPQIEFPDQKREFIFVIDRSGSMGGHKMSQARDTLLLFLRSLPPSCTFNIIGFGSSYKALFEYPKPYSDETLEEASRYAASMNADFGGTEILKPLQHAFTRGLFSAMDRHWTGVERQVFLLTDGQVSNDTQVFELIRQSCAPKSVNKKRMCRLFSVGVGQGVSRHLVAGMARAGGGTSCFVEEGAGDALRVKVLGQLKQSMQPALDNVSIEWKFPVDPKTTLEPSVVTQPIKTLLGYRSPSVEDVSTNFPQPTMYPSTTPPIFNKEKFLSYASFAPGAAKPESVVVKCDTMDGPLEVKLTISSEDEFKGSIARKLMAQTAIAEYEDNCEEYSCRYQRGPLSTTNTISESEALQLALTNGLVSSRTSFVAVLDERVILPGSAPPETKTVPQCARTLDHFIGAQTLQLSLDIPDMHDICDANCMSKVFYKRSKSRNSMFPAALFAIVPTLFTGVARLLGAIINFIRSLSPVAGVFKRKSSSHASNSSDSSKPAGSAPPFRGVETSTLSPPMPARGGADEILQLCLLQKADGSYLLNDELFQATGVRDVDAMMARVGFTDTIAFATALALAFMRVVYAKKRTVWELQAEKASAWLAKNHVSTELISKVEEEVRNLTRSKE